MKKSSSSKVVRSSVVVQVREEIEFISGNVSGRTENSIRNKTKRKNIILV